MTKIAVWLPSMSRNFFLIAIVASCVVWTSAGAQRPVQKSNTPPLHKKLSLNDCDIPFDELRSRSQSCLRTTLPTGRRCETWSASQFPEIVGVRVNFRKTFCSGTVIARSWVLTAAHCLFGSAAAGGTDVLIIPKNPQDVVVYSEAAPKRDNTRIVAKAIVYGEYEGPPDRNNDLALLQLAVPFPDDAVEPAILAPIGSFNSIATIAGYGYSNADGGKFEDLEITWPQPLIMPAPGKLEFNPLDGSAFCQGDSGGPVFAGRYRGCDSSDAGGEPRPRLIQGVMSFYVIPLPADTVKPSPIESASSCRAAMLDVSQSITEASRRAWICKITSKQPGGC